MMGTERRAGGWRGIARHLVMLMLVLMVATNVTPAAAMGCGPVDATSARTSGHSAEDTHHAGQQHARMTSLPDPGAVAMPAAVSHPGTGHRHDGPHCGHLNCPACVARLPLAPEPPGVATRSSLLLHGLALLPAGITPAPPRAPPRSL